MYLELLEQKGVKIKDLAAKRIAMRTHDAESLAYLKIFKESKTEGVYCYSTFEHIHYGDGGKVDNYFTDDDYMVGKFQEKDYVHEVDQEWVKLVYTELLKVDPKSAETYKKYFMLSISNSLSHKRLNRVLEITDSNSDQVMARGNDRMKEYKRLEVRMEIYKRAFQRIFEEAEDSVGREM